MTSSTHDNAGAGMLGFVTPVGANASDPLRDVTAVDAFWRLLPRNDPVAAQKAACGALADVVARGDTDVGRLRALLALDQRARSLVDGLLVNYGAGSRQPTSFEKPYWQAAFELCRSFGHAHGFYLQSMRDSLLSRGWKEYLPSVTMRFFLHSQIELLLRPFVDEMSTRPSWKDVHEAYLFAQSRGLLHRPLSVSRCHAPRKAETTLEREYIHVLLQDLMNDGQFPPHDAFWASQGIPGWCKTVTLESRPFRGAEHRFAVDLDADSGLVRLSQASPGRYVYLDTTPVLESLRNEVATLRDARDVAADGSTLGRARRLKLLRKLNVLYSPQPQVIARRGERRPAALTVDAVMGMAQIIRAMRSAPQDTVAAPPPAVPEVEEITITVFGGFTEVPSGGPAHGGGSRSLRPGAPVDASHQMLKLIDHSDSGCRLQGQLFRSNRVTPGTLIAFHVDAAAPWTLAVVRRVAKMAGNRIDIGAEYVGKDPRGVIITVGESGKDAAGSPDAGHPRFAALYLPESTKHPVMPIRTLILPARRFAPDDCLVMRSAKAAYAIVLKEPLEEQGDFIWSPFEIVERSTAGLPAPAAATAGAS